MDSTTSPINQSVITQGQQIAQGTNPNAISTSNLGNISQTLQNAQNAINNANTNQQTVSTGSGKKPNLLERLLPTVGGVLGGLAGGALDIGTGGLALALDPAIAGLGSAAGKAAENALTGQKVLQGNDLTSGLEGAAGQGIGMGVGKLLGAGGNALTGLGEKQLAAASDLSDQQAAAAEQERIANEFSSVKPGQASVGQAVSKLNDLGFTSPTAKDALNVGKIYTGSDPNTGVGVLNFYKNQALDQAGGTVDLGNVMSNLHDTLALPENELQLGTDNSAPGPGITPGSGTNTATSIVKQVRNMIPETLDKNGQIAEQTDPQSAQTLLKAIGSKLSKFSNLDSANPNFQTQQAEKNVWTSIYQNVRDSLYNRPEVDAAVNSLQAEPEVIDDAIKANGITDPKIAANIKADLTNTINNASSANDLLTQEAPMVNVSKVGQIQTDSEINNPQLSKNVKAIKSNSGLLDKAKANPLSTAVDLGGAYEGLIKGHPLALAGTLAYNLAKSPTALSGIGGILGKVGASAVPTIAGQVVANSPNDIAGPADQSSQIVNNNNQGTNMVEQALQEAMANPLNGGLSQIGSLLPILQKVNAAQQAANNLTGYFNQSGGAQGPVGGILSKLGSVFTGGPASSYAAQQKQAEQAIANALGVQPAAIQTPGITQNQPAAQNTLSNLQALINAYAGGTVNSAIPQ